MARGTTEPTAPLLPSHRRDQAEAEAEGEVDNYHGASFGGSVFNLSTATVGAGIMSLPAVMRVLGLIPGTVVLFLTAALASSSINLLVRFSRAANARTYGAVMRRAFGDAGAVLARLAVIVNNFGILVIYMIIIGDVLSGTTSDSGHHPGVLENWFGNRWWTGRAFVLLVPMLTIYAPLAFFKHIDSLRFTSALSVALAVVFVFVTAGITIFKLVKRTISMPRLFPSLNNMASVWNLFTVVPIVVTSYICHYNVHTIDNELRYKSQMRNVVRTSVTLCTIIYLSTSFFNYLLFGDSTLDDVLGNFDTDLGIPHSSLFNDIVRISYALHLVLVFPVAFHALRLNVDGLIFPSKRHLYSDNRRFSLLTIALLMFIYVAADFIPSIWDAFQFTGATAAVCIGFIFPAAIALRDPNCIATRWEKTLSLVMIILAVFSNAIAIYSDAYTLVNKKKNL